MALGSGNLRLVLVTRNSPPGHVPSPSGFTFRLRFRVFTVRKIDTDSRVGRHPGQLTTREPVSVSRIGESWASGPSPGQQSVLCAHVVVGPVGLHEHGEFPRLGPGPVGAAPEHRYPAG